MAYTKIKAVKNHLQRCLDYTSNPEKTESGQVLQNILAYAQNGDKTEHQLFVTGFHCDPANACEVMLRTKKRWGKDGENHVLAYHVIQSFAPGEVTPQQAHEIGCEFVRRAFAGRYEATVSTHLNTGTLHNHVVFNSVSFVDGRMFRNDFRGYFQGIRAVSDQICRERGLSVIAPERRGKAYAECKAEKEGAPTVRSMIRADVDKALARAISWETFVAGLRKMGYSVRYGPNVKYATLRHKTGSRNIRLKSLGEGYDEASIRELLARRARGEEVMLPGAIHDGLAETAEQQQRPGTAFKAGRRFRRGRLRGTLPVLPRQKITGFMALYYRYVYLLGQTKRRHTSRRCTFLLSEDFQKFDRYMAQFKYVWEHHIQTQEDLDAAKTAAESEHDALAEQRKRLYREKSAAKKVGDTHGAAALSDEIAALSAEIRVRRREVMLCGWIADDAARLRAQLTEAERAERQEQERQQKKTNKQRGYAR